ncbi:MAG: thioredoxin family protein [Desulforhopalus sp.]
MIELPTLIHSKELETVIQKKLSLIAFGTPWSSPCQIQYKILANCMRRYRDIIAIARVDVETHPGIARRCDIQTVPTLIMYRKNKEIKRLVGLQSVETLSTLIQAKRLSDINTCTAGEAESRL